MGFEALRALALDLNLTTHGVPATFTLPAPDDDPIETTGIWLTPLTDDFPVGSGFTRRDPIRVMAFSRAEVPIVKVGSRVLAPEKGGEIAKRWKVDGLDRQEADKTHVVLVPDPDLT